MKITIEDLQNNYPLYKKELNRRKEFNTHKKLIQNKRKLGELNTLKLELLGALLAMVVLTVTFKNLPTFVIWVIVMTAVVPTNYILQNNFKKKYDLQTYENIVRKMGTHLILHKTPTKYGGYSSHVTDFDSYMKKELCAKLYTTAPTALTIWEDADSKQKVTSINLHKIEKNMDKLIDQHVNQIINNVISVIVEMDPVTKEKISPKLIKYEIRDIDKAIQEVESAINEQI